MPRLPIPGSDDGVWGDILNDYLSEGHNGDGTHKTIPLSQGGTGATTAASARTNLGAASTTDLNNHLDDTADAHDAIAISFTPSGTISATNVQDAIEEVTNESGTGIVLADTNPQALGSASPGVDGSASRGDHVHPTTGLATDAELTTHASDTTAVHGIADTSVLETVSGSQAKVDTHAAAANPHTGYLLKSGGTMTGALTLSGAPTLGLHAATKTYVDGVAGVSDHGVLTGLGDDDHAQYLNNARHNALDHSTALSTAALSDLSDVAATVPNDGQVLTFDTTNGWQPENAVGVSDHGALTGLADDDHPQYLQKAGGTMTGALNLAGQELQNALLVDPREKKLAIGNSGATLAINVTTAGLQTVTIDQACTVSFTGFVNGVVRSVTIELTMATAFTVTWNGAVKWHTDNGNAPTLGANTLSPLTFYSHDGGTTIEGFAAPSRSTV